MKYTCCSLYFSWIYPQTKIVGSVIFSLKDAEFLGRWVLTTLTRILLKAEYLHGFQSLPFMSLLIVMVLKSSSGLDCYIFCITQGICGAFRVFANGLGDLGSIPGCVIPKTFKMVLDTSLLNTQQYKVCIKGKVEQSWERSCALHHGVVAIEKGAFWLPSTMVTNFTFLQTTQEDSIISGWIPSTLMIC